MSVDCELLKPLSDNQVNDVIGQKIEEDDEINILHFVLLWGKFEVIVSKEKEKEKEKVLVNADDIWNWAKDKSAENS
jgi:hypothetical protein